METLATHCAMKGMNEKEIACPSCKSNMCSRDWPSAFWFLLGWVLPPISWLLFRFNRNRWCLNCGVRFRCDAPGPFDNPHR